MRKQKLKERLRGWAFVARRRGVADSLRHCWRWLRLLTFASPRYCVYAAGLNAVSSFEFSVSDETKQQSVSTSSGIGQVTTVLHWLPIANPLARTALDEKGVAEAILWNYHEFLVETRS
jgi:hypothetical protein